MPGRPPCAPRLSRDRLHCPQNSFQTTGTRASMQLKKEVALLCKEDAVLTSTFWRARAGTEVAVTSTRVSARMESRMRRAEPSAGESIQFGWVRREGEGC